MTTSLGRLVQLNPPVPEFDLDPDSEVTFMPLECVWPDGRADTTRRQTAASVKNGYTRFRNRDILLPKITPTFEAGRVLPLELETPLGAGTTELHVLRARDGVDSRYVAYLCRSQPFIQEGATRLQGVGNLRRVPAEFIERFPVPVVDGPRQSKLADFLDGEIAQIDALIEEQDRLVDLVAERKPAVLEAAISGLDRGPVKRTKLKYLFAPSAEANHTGEEVLSVYRDHGVIPKSSRKDNFNRTPEDVSRYLLVRPGDLVVNRMKAWQGSLGVSSYRGIVSGDYEVLCPSADSALLPKYVHFLLRSPRMISEYAVRSTGIRPSQWRLYWDQLGDMEIPVPTLEGQRALVRYVEFQFELIDGLIREAQHFIDLSRERQLALITAAVADRVGSLEAG